MHESFDENLLEFTSEYADRGSSDWLKRDSNLISPTAIGVYNAVYKICGDYGVSRMAVKSIIVEHRGFGDRLDIQNKDPFLVCGCRERLFFF